MRDILGYEGLYMISDSGSVYNIKRDIIMKPFHKIGRNGEKSYLRMQLTKDKKPTKYLIHRLVATAYCDKKEDDTQVNHIDGNKLNNSYLNLEWCTALENTAHSIREGLKGGSHGVKSKSNTSGYVGVCKEGKTNKWRAQILHNSKHIYLGIYNTPELASVAYWDKYEEIHGVINSFKKDKK